MLHLLDLGSRKFWAARHEGVVEPDDPHAGLLRTDHELRFWNASAVRLHYKLERAS